MSEKRTQNERQTKKVGRIPRRRSEESVKKNRKGTKASTGAGTRRRTRRRTRRSAWFSVRSTQTLGGTFNLPGYSSCHAVTYHTNPDKPEGHAGIDALYCRVKRCGNFRLGKSSTISTASQCLHTYTYVPAPPGPDSPSPPPHLPFAHLPHAPLMAAAPRSGNRSYPARDRKPIGAAGVRSKQQSTFRYDCMK